MTRRYIRAVDDDGTIFEDPESQYGDKRFGWIDPDGYESPYHYFSPAEAREVLGWHNRNKARQAQANNNT